MKVILGSKSPRRQELLKGMGIDFELRTMDVEEDFPADMPALEVAEFLAKKKANAMRSLITTQDEVLITSDTTVVLDNQIYNKPVDEADAIRILSLLSGKTHTVVTGVCLTSLEKQISFNEHAYVTFAEMSQSEILNYIRTYRPYDKAGAYAIQEWIGLTQITKMEGTYSNIMGLPTARLNQVLKEFS
jgi:septum formation protein